MNFSIHQERPITLASKKLLFGTAGIPKSSPVQSTLGAISHIVHLGLDCLEIETVKGWDLRSDLARKIGKEARDQGIHLSLHAPYYINLNSKDEGKRLTSQERLLHSARMASLCGAKSVIFHPGYYGKSSLTDSFQKIKKGLQEVVSLIKKDRIPITLRPETMGKKSQFGSFEEILFLCREVDGIYPCIDFSHIHAREGKFNSYLEFYRMLKKLRKKLGDQALKNIHIHISGCEYNDKGEMKHIDLEDSDFRYDEWIQVLKDFELEGTVICESPNLEQDAVMLKKLFS